jgi:hypothetical protein
MSSTREFTITNPGVLPVAIESISLTGGTGLITLSDLPVMPYALDGSQSVSFDITASSTVVGTSLAELSIGVDTQESPFTFPVTASFFNPDPGGSIQWPNSQSPTVGAFVAVSPSVLFTDFTIEFWAKVTSPVAPSNFGRLLDTPSTNNFIVNYRTSGPNIALETNPYQQVTNTAAMTVNTWIHWAFVRQGTAGRIYKNGVLIKTDVVPTTSITLNRITIGSTGGEACGGRMSDLRYWSVARTTAEILANYQVRLTTPQTGLLAYYKLNQPTELFADATGTYANLTKQATTWNADAPPPFV